MPLILYPSLMSLAARCPAGRYKLLLLLVNLLATVGWQSTLSAHIASCGNNRGCSGSHALTVTASERIVLFGAFHSGPKCIANANNIIHNAC